MGEISVPGERDFWPIEFDPHRFYIIEILGSGGSRDLLGDDTSKGALTLEDPDTITLWNSHQTRVHITGSTHRGGNYISPMAIGGPGPFQLEVGPAMLAAGGEGTGTYQIKVRVNNYCVMRDGEVAYPWAGADQKGIPTAPTTPQTRLRIAPCTTMVPATGCQ